MQRNCTKSPAYNSTTRFLTYRGIAILDALRELALDLSGGKGDGMAT